MPATILVVENDDECRNSMSALLRMRGYAIVEALNGEDALEQARTCFPDLILLDLGLPILNGLKVASALRSDPLTSEIPILAISGSLERWTVGNDSPVFDACLAKPFSARHLVQAIDSHVASLR